MLLETSSWADRRRSATVVSTGMSRFKQPLLRSSAHQVVRFAEELRLDWSRTRVSGLSAEIAFFALLGLFPAVVVFAAALGSLDVVMGESAAADTEQWVLNQVQEIFGSDNTLRSTIAELFERSNAGLITVGIVLTMYLASRGFVAMVRALDVAYGHDQPRTWLSTRVLGLGLTASTILVAALVAAMVVVGPLLGGGEEVAERLGAGSAFTAAWGWLRWPLVFAVLVSWAASVYHMASRRRVPWRRELPGAVVGTVWWLVVSAGFRAYLELASSGVNAVFGLLGGALSLLLWLYLLAMGLLAGAGLNVVWTHRRQ